MAILGIDEGILLDSQYIKVIDSIAGAGKSTMIDNFFKSQGVTYMRLTSTNALKKSAEDKYGMKCYTIASGLFTNENGHFYKDFKEPDCFTVVIDEVLQSHKKVFEWCKAHVGTYNIIITTDSHQMLAPEQESLLDDYNDFCKMSNVVYSNVTKTLRARTKDTETKFNEYYDRCSDDCVSLTHLHKNFKIIEYKNMPFTTQDTYITHTNNLENYLYLEKELANNPNVELIPKGAIASRKNPKRESFPILSQFAADNNKKVTSYFQVANVATPTRYQGSEVEQGHTLYYIIESNSRITYRELYTVVTRLWDIRDMKIVICDDAPEFEEITTFNELPVKHQVYLHIDYEGDTQFMSKKQMSEFLAENYPDTDTVYYNKEVVYSNKYGDKTRLVAMQVKGAKLFQPEYGYGRKITAGSLVKRDGALQYSYMSQVYRDLERHGLDHVRAPRCLNKRVFTKYEVDLTSAYPLILKFCDVPTDGLLSHTPSKDLMNFYIYRGKKFSNNSLVTDELAELIRNEDLGELEYIFSTPKKKGCIPGEYLYQQAHSSVESKKAIKEVHYGFWEKPLLKIAPTGDCYLINDNQRYELLMASICSTLCYHMFRLNEAIGGKYIKVDAVHFDDETGVFDKIKNTLPDYFDWKIVECDTDTILYTNYTPVKTRNQIKNEQAKAKRAAMTPEELEEARAKKREAMKRYREKKKLEKQNQI